MLTASSTSQICGLHYQILDTDARIDRALGRGSRASTGPADPSPRHSERRDPKGEWYDGGDPKAVRLLLNIALSDLITNAANPPRPIDFQVQSMSEANVPEHGMRNPMGMRR